MQYGFFDDKRKEYVIETPATPMPWINYLGSQEFFSLISNTAGGYCFYRDAKLQRILRYRYNNVPADVGGRFFYIKEEDKAPWSPTFHPVDRPLDSYRCRHGMGYTVFETEKDGLYAELTFLVPIGENCEVQRVRLTNRSAETKRFRFTAAVEWCLWNTVDDATNFQRNLNIGELEVEGSAIYHKTEYRERRNHYAYYGVNAPIAGYDTDRDHFLGTFGTFARPQAILSGKTGDFVAHGGAPMAGLALDVTLAPGEERGSVFVLGYGKNPRDRKFLTPGVIRKDTAYRVLKKFSTDTSVENALTELAEYWDKLLGVYTLESGDEKLNRMVNIWHQYQCMVTFNMSRSASYFESGTGRGMGFRDSCQDLLGFVHMAPERARERIIDIASIQWADGSTYHQYQPLTKRGNNDVGSGFNDDPLWLVACTYAYISETGDFSILEHPTPFDNVPGSEAPLMEHLRRSVRYTMNHKGPHGLPLIGRADWNDCLNLNCFSEEPGESFQTTGPSEGPVAESVFIGGMFVLYGKQYASLCRYAGLDNEAAEVEAAAAEMEAAVKTAGWDGDWFVRAMMLTAMPWEAIPATRARFSSSPRVCASWPASELTTAKRFGHWTPCGSGCWANTAWSCWHPAIPFITKSWEKLPAILPDTRKTAPFSATTTLGSASRKPLWAEERMPLISTAEPALFIRRNTATFAGWNPMSMPRRWRPALLTMRARQETAGSLAQLPGRS